MLAGIVTDLRIVNGQRGKVAIFKLDDKTAAVECVVAEELLNANLALLKDDELLLLQGKPQPDRFSGGVRFNVQQIWDLPTARCRHARYLSLPVPQQWEAVDQLLKAHAAQRLVSDEGETTLGVPLRLRVERDRAVADIDLGDASRFYPSDDALKRWQQLTAGLARLVYQDESA